MHLCACVLASMQSSMRPRQVKRAAALGRLMKSAGQAASRNSRGEANSLLHRTKRTKHGSELRPVKWHFRLDYQACSSRICIPLQHTESPTQELLWGTCMQHESHSCHIPLVRMTHLRGYLGRSWDCVTLSNVEVDLSQAHRCSLSKMQLSLKFNSQSQQGGGPGMKGTYQGRQEGPVKRAIAAHARSILNIRFSAPSSTMLAAIPFTF